jgi:hypothetical protein
MTEKPQFEHKNPRIVAVSDRLRPARGVACGAAGGLHPCRTGAYHRAVVALGTGGKENDLTGPGPTARPDRRAVAYDGQARMEFQQ